MSLPRLLYCLFCFIIACKPPLPERSFSFCASVSQLGCIPPRLGKQALFTIAAPKPKATMADFYEQLALSGDMLAFEYFPQKDRQKISSEDFANFKAFYRIEESPRFPMEQLNYHGDFITGFTLLGSILEKKYAREKELPFKLPAPLIIEYELELGGKILHRATVELILRLK